MFLTVWKRLTGNRWKVLSMLFGLTLALAMAFSVPVYSQAILQRLMVKTFEDSLKENERHPAYLSEKYELASLEKDAFGARRTVKESFERTLNERMGLPVQTSGEYIRYSMLYHDANNTAGRKSILFYYVSDLPEHVSLTTGRMYDPDRADGVVEAVVRRTFLVNSELTLGQVYDIKSAANGNTLFRMEIVGIFEAADDSDIFWFTRLDRFGGNIFIDSSCFDRVMAETPSATRHVTQIVRFAAVDYTAIRMKDVPRLIGAVNEGMDEIVALTGKKGMYFSAMPVLEQVSALAPRVYVTLYSLLVPLLVLVAFYVVMIARLKLKSELNEISVMQSRGAGRGHILLLYLIESVILVGIAAVLGPLLGVVLCRMIGASDGFLSFVNRRALPLEIGPEAFWSVGAAALLFVLITMIPAFFSAGVNIVQRKRAGTERRLPFYHRFGLDFLFLAAGLYGWYSMRVRMLMLEGAGAFTLENTDVMMYVSGTLFALGAGMLFLRLYPYLLRLVFALGRRIWPAWAYFTMNRLSRNRECAGIMLFMILTLSIGITSADTARSINRYEEANIKSEVGADLVYTPVWQKYDETGKPARGHVVDGNKVEIYDEGVLVQSFRVSFFELLTDSFREIEGIESIARVYREEDTTVKRSGGQTQGVDVMLTDPAEFARTASWIATESPYHINEYANAMNRTQNGAVISSALRDSLKLELGDKILVLVGAGNIECTVVGVVDTWPGLDAYTPAVGSDELTHNKFVVAKLSTYVRTNEVRPYDFFIKKTPGYTDRQVYDALAESEFGVVAMTSAGEKLAAAKNTPLLQGTNGLLTVSFLAATALCAAGFLVFWVISIRERTLQFGISRALGLTRGGVMLMLGLEQLLVSGVAIASGVLIGKLQSAMFVPFLSMNYTEAGSPVAFRVVTRAGDMGMVLAVLGAVLAVCLAAILTIVLRLKVDRALKLGED